MPDNDIVKEIRERHTAATKGMLLVFDGDNGFEVREQGGSLVCTMSDHVGNGCDAVSFAHSWSDIDALLDLVGAADVIFVADGRFTLDKLKASRAYRKLRGGISPAAGPGSEASDG